MEKIYKVLMLNGSPRQDGYESTCQEHGISYAEHRNGKRKDPSSERGRACMDKLHKIKQ